MTGIIWREEWLEYCRRYVEPDIGTTDLDLLVDTFLLPIFERCGRVAALRRDLASVVCSARLGEPFGVLKSWNLAPDTIAVAPSANTLIEAPLNSREVLPAEFYAAARNLIEVSRKVSETDLEHPQTRQYVGPATVSSRSKEILRFASSQAELSEQIRGDRSTHFANSAYYMGSKRTLGPFIVESLRSVLQPNDIILDLMCGSGAASKALSYRWRTIAADALEFCVTLARGLGAGYSVKQATQTLDFLTGHVREHARKLEGLATKLVKSETEFFYAELDDETIRRYIDFARETPRYPEGGKAGDWYPVAEVDIRRDKPKETPYCLVTAYFANVYFGMRQSIEIDSIRYAIDRLDPGADRDFALAALVAACSQLGSGYAGQFAQPVNLTLTKAPSVIAKRSQSVFQEFSVRFMALAAESEKSVHEITTLRGSSDDVIADVSQWRSNRPQAVYLDAPYTREEYSRYYHVLETIVRYSYPTSTGKGRSPARSDPGYFRSPFFTKSVERVVREIVRVILTVLKQGWVCAWSYSDQGTANILDVIEHVQEKAEVDILSYTAPHQYKAQGRRGAKRASEYCVIFIPR